jgi:Fanconi anemia group M protein
MLFNIFSKKSAKSKPSEKAKIMVDIHEKDSSILSELHELGAETEIKSLKVGDYLVSNVILERKTISDFISSIINKRLIKQLNELKTYKKRLLIIEGDLEQSTSNFNPNAIRGMILSIELEMEIPIIFTKNIQDTSKFLIVLAKKQKNTEFSFHSKKGLTRKQQLEYILQGFRGIGPSTSKKLLKKYKNLKTIFNLSQEDLEKEIGKKSRALNILEENY